jgi:hypothetical protein
LASPNARRLEARLALAVRVAGVAFAEEFDTVGQDLSFQVGGRVGVT